MEKIIYFQRTNNKSLSINSVHLVGTYVYVRFMYQIHGNKMTLVSWKKILQEIKKKKDEKIKIILLFHFLCHPVEKFINEDDQ